MDNEKDLYIKEKLRQDQLISKKAEDIFNNFKGDDFMKDEKIVDMNSKNTTKEKYKRDSIAVRILLSVASFSIIFIGANVYASNNGYGNIFFMINDLVKKSQTAQGEELLNDKEILISYEGINVGNKLEVRIPKLHIKNDKGTLYVNIDRLIGYEDFPTFANENMPIKIEVYDKESNKLIGSKDTGLNERESVSYEEIALNGLTENIDEIRVKMVNKANKNMLVMDINLSNKAINIIENPYAEIEKISEIELKEIIAKYVRINEYEEHANNVSTEKQKMQIKNNLIVTIAQDIMGFGKNYKIEEINKAIEEFSGKRYTGPLDIGEPGIDAEYYSEEDNAYIYEGRGMRVYQCLEIEDISLADDIYTVTFTYCEAVPGLVAVDDETEIFRQTMKLKVNDNYTYAKYRIIDIDNLQSEKIAN